MRVHSEPRSKIRNPNYRKYKRGQASSLLHGCYQSAGDLYSIPILSLLRPTRNKEKEGEVSFVERSKIVCEKITVSGNVLTAPA